MKNTTSMVADKIFPLLEIELFLDNSGRLEFKIQWKKYQLLKYLNKERTNSEAAFKATPKGVLNILAKVKSRTWDNTKMISNERYYGHKMALTKAGLNMKTFTTLKELLKIQMIGIKMGKKNKNKEGRET